MENKYVICENQSETRLDKCIAILDEKISRMMVSKLLEEGKVTVNR